MALGREIRGIVGKYGSTPIVRNHLHGHHSLPPIANHIHPILIAYFHKPQREFGMFAVFVKLQHGKAFAFMDTCTITGTQTNVVNFIAWMNINFFEHTLGKVDKEDFIEKSIMGKRLRRFRAVLVAYLHKEGCRIESQFGDGIA